MVHISKKNILVPELDKEELKNNVDSVDENVESSENAAEDSSEDEEDVKAIQEALEKNPRSKNRVDNRILPEHKKVRGVVYIGHIPKGFAEPQIKQFMGQFGEITRMRLARSIKTGRMKGYGFVEFELGEVAAVVAKTMNQYLLYGRTLVVKKMPVESIHASLFKNCHKRITNTERLNRHKAKQHHNKTKVIKAEDGSEIQAKSSRQLQRRVEGGNKKKRSLALQGIDYEFTGNNSASATKAEEKKVEKKKVEEKKVEKKAPKEDVSTTAPSEEKKKVKATAKPQKNVKSTGAAKGTKKTAMKSKK